MPSSKAGLYAAIRRDARAGMSGRAIEKKYRVGRRTIVKALSSAWPELRKQLPPRASKLDPFKPVIGEILKADLGTPRKQRHTITRVWHRLIGEHGMEDVSYPVVRAYVAERKPQIRAEAGRGPAEVFVPQSHRPGDEAEVDFGEVVVRLAGQDVGCFLFCLRLSFSGKAVRRVSLSGGQEAFFEGHEHAFRVLGGVPAGKIRYDSLKSAVAQVIGFSRSRVETDRWTAFRSRWGLDAFYCQPGIAGAHEKGGVDGQIGWFRRNHLVPVPGVPSIGALNAMTGQRDADDEARRVGGRARTAGEFLAIERPLLRPLPAEPFETGLWLTPRVDRFGQVMARNNRYSVPVRLIGRRVRALLHSSELVIYDGRTEAARHERLPGKSGARLDLDHYLEALVRKPDRVSAYRAQHGRDARGAAMAVIIQRLVHADRSGVLFTVNPGSSDPGELVVSSLFGLGEGLVSGEADADTVVIGKQDGEIKTRRIGEKETRLDPLAGGGCSRTLVAEAECRTLSVTEDDIHALWRVGIELESLFGGPQDVEWAVADAKLWILQSRPITSLEPQPAGPEPATGAWPRPIIWDNSNIIESFGDLTGPLTFTFAQHVYHRVHLEYCRTLGIRGQVLQEMDQWQRLRLGYFSGRVYYNLPNWYRLQRMLPLSGAQA